MAPRTRSTFVHPPADGADAANIGERVSATRGESARAASTFEPGAEVLVRTPDQRGDRRAVVLRCTPWAFGNLVHVRYDNGTEAKVVAERVRLAARRKKR